MDAALLNTMSTVLDKFKIHDPIINITEMKMGHINNTYYVSVIDHETNKEKFYVVQRININVFKDPILIMNNIDIVCEHIRKNNPKEALHFHHTYTGDNYFVDKDAFWRLYTYFDGVAVDGEITEDIMRNVGQAFSIFQARLGDIDASLLYETIPYFHDTERRYKHFIFTTKKDPLKRVEKIKEDIAKLEELKEYGLMVSYHKREMPLRVTHNDTKTNNALLNKDTFKPLCVIDLDTVMPGLIVHDFGDAIRYGANTASEDETDLSKVKLSLPLYRAFAEGFLKEIKDILTPAEKEYMAYGALAMTFECGMRFLDDYIDGDNYFKINYPTHNLDRARCQFALLEDMVNHLDEMKQIIADIVK